MKCNEKLRCNEFSVNVFLLATVFRWQFSKNWQFQAKLLVFWKLLAKYKKASTKTFTKKLLGRNSALHITSYLSIALSKILPHSKTIKNAKKLSAFGENDSRRLSKFLQTHVFWKFDHISRTYNKINYRNIWFAKVKAILIMMAQVPFLHIFFKKDPHFNGVEKSESFDG